MQMTPQAELLKKLRDDLDRAEIKRLSGLACPSAQSLRRRPDPLVESGHRQSFQVDADRILHSLAYTRYIDKTQVFSLVENDHITHRVLHVQLVSKISRTIGRLLALNEDLIEAIALGHDLGHAPFGHDGETHLSELSQAHGLSPFVHPVQSVRALDLLEGKGKGLNLSLQVLDGILCHDGEADRTDLIPERDKDWGRFRAELGAKERDPGLELRPMTLEGCVVRLADTIAYIGRDLEDAIRLGLITREELPPEAARTLGRTNGTIVFRLVEDLLASSLDQEGIGFSPPVAQALRELKNFNRARIYNNPEIKTHGPRIKSFFALLFQTYLDQILNKDEKSLIISDFLSDMEPSYLDRTPPAMMVRDFMAGMTDDFFLTQAQRTIPSSPID